MLSAKLMHVATLETAHTRQRWPLAPDRDNVIGRAAGNEFLMTRGVKA